MPQKKSYFALQLPKRWWVFGLDLALHGDIDVYQFKFFSELIKEKVLLLISFHLYNTVSFSMYELVGHATFRVFRPEILDMDTAILPCSC